MDDVADVNDCAEWDMCTQTGSNLSEDPSFSGVPVIASDSPCIDEGADPSDFGYDIDADYDGDPRPTGDGYDIGADEYVP